MIRRTQSLALALLGAPALLLSTGAQAQQTKEDSKTLAAASQEAEQQLHQTFTNLQFEDFGPSPISGPIYQAVAGGRIIYFAPQSEHLIFAAVYNKDGVNLTALAQEAGAQRKLKGIDPAKAFAIGPANAPTVIEFTDPSCPYCQALERFWEAKAIEGKPVRRLVYFVSVIHPDAAAKAEHILCSPDPQAEFKAVYAGRVPATLRQCAAGHQKVEDDAAIVAHVGISGTPTVMFEGRVLSGFQQAELEAFLDRSAQPKAASDAPH
jgi:thiol:disulfide interchange protein DsbC